MTSRSKPEKQDTEIDESWKVVFDRRPLWIVIFDRLRRGIVVAILLVGFFILLANAKILRIPLLSKAWVRLAIQVDSSPLEIIRCLLPVEEKILR